MKRRYLSGLWLGSVLAAVFSMACGTDVLVVDGAASGAGGQTATSTNGPSTATTSTGTSGGGGTDAFLLCESPSDCTIVARTCCGVCSEPQLDDVIAVAKEQQQAYRESVCDPGQPCPLCAAEPNPDLFASCVGASDNAPGQCQAFDVSQTAIGACQSDDDCVLRNGLACCESCTTATRSTLVAINKNEEGALHDLVCEGDVACPECAPSYPPNAKAVCEAGSCRVAGF